ncbi:MAG: cyclic pyranopterin monophosphate synthase MoaC [Verrucomicrobiota bacterium]
MGERSLSSHINRRNQPAMVNVGAKAVTRRTARVRAIVSLPRAVLSHLERGEIQSTKGPVFQTAILAGIMAAKRTAELIPLCHPIGIEDCRVDIRLNPKKEAVIECCVEAHHKTGVEMEALTGAAVAALTLYDMCKGWSHDIVIKEIRLLEKEGGKSDFQAR